MTDAGEMESGQSVRRESYSVRRIRAIAEIADAGSYLEIGVNKGETFNNLQFKSKVAVDPNFRFDVAGYQSPGTQFHEMTSDRYFVEHRPSEKFDIIFLDGLHVFQQTFRDFCNTLSCCHDGTVWLIDDVFPVDVYSSWPNQREAYDFRKRSGSDSRAWHGDIYKLVAAIHDFFPMMRYATIVDSDNPQTLVWRAPRPDHAPPVFNSLEKIERLSYFELLKRESILMAMPEKAALQALADSHTSPGMPGNSVTPKRRSASRNRTSVVPQ